MIRLYWVTKTQAVVKTLGVASSIAIFLAGGLLKFEPTVWVSRPFHDIVAFNQEWAWLMIPIFATLGSGAALYKAQFGTKSNWVNITQVLEEYKKALFDDRPECKNDGAYHHRVTLYKYTSFRVALCKYPLTGWVVPVARTKHSSLSRIPRYRVPKKDRDKAEGVAGAAYANNTMVPAYDLPIITKSSSDAERAKYSKFGQVSLDWIEKRLKKKKCDIRALTGIPVEVKGEPWGVVVVDSRRPEQIITAEELKDNGHYSSLANMLSKLLEN